MTIASSHLRPFLVAEWFVLSLLMIPGEARANVGPPSSGGQLVAEPAGIKDIAITRENLTIDLRPLATNGLASVEAVYQLHNHGAERKLDLLFAGGSAVVSNFQVWLGDQPVASAPVDGKPLPRSWRPPIETPGIRDEQGLDYLMYDRRRVRPVAFTIVVPSGPHVLKVQYAAEAAKHLYGQPTMYHQLAYVLAPARAWSEFGGLDVAIHLPRNWRAACTPKLTRVADTLKASFPDLPADAIALTVQAPEGWIYGPIVYGTSVLFSVACLFGTSLCWNGGRSIGRSPAHPAKPRPGWIERHAWPRSLGLGILYGLAVLGSGVLAALGPDWVLPAGQASHYGYWNPSLMLVVVFFLSALAVPSGFVIAQLTAVIVRRRAIAKVRQAPMPNSSVT